MQLPARVQYSHRYKTINFPSGRRVDLALLCLVLAWVAVSSNMPYSRAHFKIRCTCEAINKASVACTLFILFCDERWLTAARYHMLKHVLVFCRALSIRRLPYVQGQSLMIFIERYWSVVFDRCKDPKEQLSLATSTTSLSVGPRGPFIKLPVQASINAKSAFADFMCIHRLFDTPKYVSCKHVSILIPILSSAQNSNIDIHTIWPTWITS